MLDRDTVIVLHMMGSHGPAYWKRYPEKFETFKPACKDSQFSRCELADDRQRLRQYDPLHGPCAGASHRGAERAASHGVDAGMLYVSDHGESLGENGMYLHGMPYVIAPEAQIHVPMVVWLSPQMKAARGIDQGCMMQRAARARRA